MDKKKSILDLQRIRKMLLIDDYSIFKNSNSNKYLTKVRIASFIVLRGCARTKAIVNLLKFS